MVSSTHNGQHHIRFYEFIDKLKITIMATSPFPPKVYLGKLEKKKKLIKLEPCRRGLFLIPTIYTSNINCWFTYVCQMPHEPPPERKLVYLVSQ